MKKRRRRKINEISILQKYSSNRLYRRLRSLRHVISILQKYSSNLWTQQRGHVSLYNFNTTKVLFKQKNLSASSQGDKQFQYYKSTLQTRRKPAYLWYIHEYF